jgi:RimJ/RimL family protein N-acetyltransferase
MLRPPVAADAATFAELANDLGVVAMTSRMPYPYRQGDAEAFLGLCARRRPAEGVAFALEHRQFGVIGVLEFDLEDPRRPELGYWLGRPFWGRGYATEAVKAALSWYRGEWGRSVVWAGHFADNRASAQVLIKAGFLYTGDVEPRGCLARGEAVATRMMVWLA